MVDQPAPPTAEIIDGAGELLRVLGAPVRLAIVLELMAGPRSVQELVEALAVSQPLVSQHLRVLRAARLVAAQPRHRERVYCLVDDHVRHIAADAIVHATENAAAHPGRVRG